MEGSRMTGTTETPQATAEVIPFPLARTSSWRFIAAEYASRPEKGRYDKAAYAEKVIQGNVERLQRLGVEQKYIDAEIASLERLLFALRDDEKKRA
jgi:hypothetical protein